jgi:hypothetical protein
MSRCVIDTTCTVDGVARSALPARALATDIQASARAVVKSILALAQTTDGAVTHCMQPAGQSVKSVIGCKPPFLPFLVV